jgi:hypothetical protein
VVPTFYSIKRSYELPPLIKPREWDGDKLRWPNIQNMDYDTTSNNFEHQPIKRSFPTQHNTPNTTLPPTQKHAAAYFTLTSHTPPALIHICHRYIFNDGWIKQPIKFWVLLISVPKTLVKVLKEVILYWKNTLYTFKTLTQISMYFLLYLCSLNTTRKINFREGRNPSLMSQISVTNSFSDGFSDELKSMSNFNVANI